MVHELHGDGTMEAVEDALLRLLRRQGYSVSRQAGEGASGNPDGNLAMLQGRDHRALIRFLWGPDESVWRVDTIAALRGQMDALQATRGYLVTNGTFEREAVALAEDGAIALTDRLALNNILATMPLRGGPGMTDRPLPFAKYIPWFVGISLVVIVAVVLLLTSAVLTMYPV